MSENIVEEALAKGKFSVLGAAKGDAYPEDNITVFADAKSAYEAAKVEKRINDETDPQRAAELEIEKQEHIDAVKASALTFYMRGHAPGITKLIQKAADKEFGPDNRGDVDLAEKNTWKNDSYLAEDIVRVVNAAGEVDDHKWTPEDVVALKAWLPDPEVERLFELMFQLTFARDVFDQAVGPDFSRRR